jgi:hypothetical protein
MEKKTGIYIEQVGNGFLVRPVHDRYTAVPIDDVQVFQTMSALVLWLADHFDHRSAIVPLDIGRAA